MKPIVQLERTGCGIAAVAAVAGVSHRHAQRTADGIGIVASDRRLWSETAHVRRLLRELGLRPASLEQPFRSWISLPISRCLPLNGIANRGDHTGTGRSSYGTQKGNGCWTRSGR